MRTIKKIILICVALLFFSCNYDISNEDILSVSVNVNNKLNSEKFKYIKGDGEVQYYSVNINLLNKADTVLDVVTMSCTWQENFMFNNQKLFLLFDSTCGNNFPNPIKIQPKQTKNFKGVICVNDSILDSNNKYLKLGFVLVKMHEVSYSVEFKEVLKKKIEKKQDIIWSEEIKGVLN